VKRVIPLVLAACGGQAPAAPSPPRPAPPDAAVAIPPAPDAAPAWPVPADDAAALALWATIAPTGDSWVVQLDEVPDEPPELREALARALLREGNFSCAPRLVEGCTTLTEMPPPGADATLADPCLRRVLALWALDQLPEETLEEELAADLLAIAALPPPEEALPAEILRRIDRPDLKLQLLGVVEAAGHEQIADTSLSGLGDQDLADAAAMHIDGALEGLDPTTRLGAFVKALGDPGLRPETRMAVARELGELGLVESDPAHAEVLGALAAARGDARCDVAGVAALGHARMTAVMFPPRPSKKATPAAQLRAMCMAIHGTGDSASAWASFADPAGVTIREHTDEGMEVRRVPLADFDAEEVAAELVRALPTCDKTTCTLAPLRARYELGFRKLKGRYLLQSIDRYDLPDPPC
jgi:hypothetical protein